MLMLIGDMNVEICVDVDMYEDDDVGVDACVDVYVCVWIWI